MAESGVAPRSAGPSSAPSCSSSYESLYLAVRTDPASRHDKQGMTHVTLPLDSTAPSSSAATASVEAATDAAAPRWWTRLLVGLAAGIVAATVLGAAARLLMRLAALAAGAETGFTWLGSLMVVVAFAMFVMPGAVLAALWLGRGRSLLLVIGGLGFCLPVFGTATTDLGAAGELTTLQWTGALAATGGIFVCALAIPVVTLRLIRLGLRLTARA